MKTSIATYFGVKTVRLLVQIDAELFDQIERFLESQLPDSEAADILQSLEAAEIERTAKALRERFVISEPPTKYQAK
ncbi:MAG: hypothetical protein SFY66_18460 [Oculatellaceae cyanobacterium bins.114]|nr:hypothetical protein [Oculatellaceae cyanobacterium bins.114]